jgi:hypothetical protein
MGIKQKQQQQKLLVDSKNVNFSKQSIFHFETLLKCFLNPPILIFVCFIPIKIRLMVIMVSSQK